jgi:flavorubredoxin
MKFDIIDPGVRLQYVPDKEGLNACFELGKKIGKTIAEQA